MRIIVSTFLLMMFSIVCMAQTNHTFSLQGKALGYSGGGSQNIAADAGATIQLTPTISARQDNIIISTQDQNANLAAFSMGGVQYKLPIKKGNFDSYVIGEFGEVTNAMATTMAASVGGGVNYIPPSTPSLEVNLFEVRYLYGNVPTGGGKVTQNGVAFAVGLTFGK